MLSKPDPSWAGRTGHVHQAVAEDFPDLCNHQVYACGNPAMVKAASTAFVTSHQLSDEEFYADPFVASGNQLAQINV